MSKAEDAFRTISEVADDLDVPKHVLRFWENRFPQIKPMKRGGGRRYYRPADLELLRGIRHLLHNEGYTIKGVQKILREQGLEVVKSCWQPGRQLRPDPATKSATGKAAPAKARKAVAGRKAAARGAGSERAGVIADMVKELQACRAILAGTAPRKAAAKSRRA